MLAKTIDSKGWDMMETELSQCAVCGSEVGDLGKCKVCGTILEDGGATCEKCGRPLPALAFSCTHCKDKDKDRRIELSPEKEEILRHFMLFPGMTREMAMRLIREGLKDFATLIGMSLTESQRDKGLHQMIARKIMLLDVAEGKNKVDVTEKLECPVCKSLIDTDSERCRVCGRSTYLSIDGKVETKLKGKYEEIRKDRAFREMPKDFQKEISEVLTKEDEEDVKEGEGLEEANEEEELQEIEEELDKEWESIDSDLEELKEPPQTMMVCPVCETEVVENARFCSGCGAKFAQE